MQSHDLVDIWRLLYPIRKYFPYFSVVSCTSLNWIIKEKGIKQRNSASLSHVCFSHGYVLLWPPSPSPTNFISVVWRVRRSTSSMSPVMMSSMCSPSNLQTHSGGLWDQSICSKLHLTPQPNAAVLGCWNREQEGFPQCHTWKERNSGPSHLL